MEVVFMETSIPPMEVVEASVEVLKAFGEVVEVEAPTYFNYKNQ